jgi:nucleoside-diphosphate-sugar epimerase
MPGWLRNGGHYVKIFVTGASGFVGGAFAKSAGATHSITAMSRSTVSDAKIAALGAVPIRCSLDDVAQEYVQGAEAVVHCAAFVEEWGPWRSYWQANVEGTKRLLAASKAAGVKRFVHIGTEAALFHGQPMRDVDETYPLSLNSPFPYSRTKAWAEKAVREASDPAAGFETIVIRPRFVWGPGDETILPVVRRMAEEDRLPGLMAAAV